MFHFPKLLSQRTYRPTRAATDRHVSQMRPLGNEASTEADIEPSPTGIAALTSAIHRRQASRERSNVSRHERGQMHPRARAPGSFFGPEGLIAPRGFRLAPLGQRCRRRPPRASGPCFPNRDALWTRRAAQSRRRAERARRRRSNDPNGKLEGFANPSLDASSSRGRWRKRPRGPRPYAENMFPVGFTTSGGTLCGLFLRSFIRQRNESSKVRNELGEAGGCQSHQQEHVAFIETWLRGGW